MPSLVEEQGKIRTPPFTFSKIVMNYIYYPAPGKANLLAEIEERLELLNQVFEKYEPAERSCPTVQSVMTAFVGSYGYTYEEYQYGVDMA